MFVGVVDEAGSLFSDLNAPLWIPEPHELKDASLSPPHRQPEIVGGLVVWQTRQTLRRNHHHGRRNEQGDEKFPDEGRQELWTKRPSRSANRKLALQQTAARSSGPNLGAALLFHKVRFRKEADQPTSYGHGEACAKWPGAAPRVSSSSARDWRLMAPPRPVLLRGRCHNARQTLSPGRRYCL